MNEQLRADEGIDAISSLAPNSASSNLLVGGTNTVYAWLVQWLADNLGYDVSSLIGLPYDWRLSPSRMQERDGFLTLTRGRIEAAVAHSGSPGIVVAHSVSCKIVDPLFYFFALEISTNFLILPPLAPFVYQDGKYNPAIFS